MPLFHRLFASNGHKPAVCAGRFPYCHLKMCLMPTGPDLHTPTESSSPAGRHARGTQHIRHGPFRGSATAGDRRIVPSGRTIIRYWNRKFMLEQVGLITVARDVQTARKDYLQIQLKSDGTDIFLTIRIARHMMYKVMPRSLRQPYTACCEVWKPLANL